MLCKEGRIKDMKKHISLALSIIMLLTTLMSSVAQAAFMDVTNETKYYEAITTLSKLNVINGYQDGTFKPEGNITRAEFTKIVTYTLGLGDLKTPPTEFSDVNDHWAKFNIKTAYDQGIINGMGDGTFAPDANVTYEQALKMVVCMLGYKTHAELAGGYPEGYRAQAATLKLTEDVSGLAYDAPATRGAIAQVMYNALEVGMMETNAVGNIVEADKTLLNDYLNVVKFEGIVVGVEDYVTADNTMDLNLGEMSILGKRNEGEIVIDYSDYTKSVTDISKYLGKLITVYYQELKTTGERKLMFIDDESNQNTEYQINFDQLDSFKKEYLYYYETSEAKKTSSLKFSLDDITVRYNGKMVAANDDIVLKKTTVDENGLLSTNYSDEMNLEEALTEWLDPESEFFIYGDITLTDREADGTINDIQINDYNTIVAYKTPTTTDYKISDKIITGNGLVLDPYSTNYTYTIVKNGSQIPVTSVSAGDIVLYGESLDEELYTCVVKQSTVTGTITAIDRDEDIITIDNVDYNIGEMLDLYVSTNQDGKSIETSQSGTFYVDKYNTVVYGTIAEEKSKPYAYITNTYASDDGSEQFLAAFIPSKATTGAANYKIRDRVKVNDETMSATEAVSYLKDLAQDEIAEGIYYNNNDALNSDNKENVYGSSSTKVTNSAQIVRLDINASNEVTEIITVTTDEDDYNEDGTTAITTNEDTSKIVRCKDLAQYNYTSSSFTISNKTQFSINSSTTIIYVPADRTQKTEYAKKSTSSFTSTEKYFVEAYDINASKVAGLVILYGTSGSITDVSKTTDYSIIAKAPTLTYDEDEDENKLAISVYAGTSSAIKTWTTKSKSEFDDVEVGDVIQFAYDQNRYAQDRIDIIKFADIAEVLDGKEIEVENEDGETHKEAYNWTEAPEDEDSVQTELFNYRFPKAKASSSTFYETYTSSTLGTIPYSRACMYNVYQIQEDSNKLLVTQGGFEVDEDGNVANTLYNTDDYEEITISSSTKIVRMESNRKEFSPYVEDTETAMTYLDLKAAQNFGTDCSKILVCSLRGSARLIVVYN